MKKLLKILRPIRVLIYKYSYHMLILAAVFSVINHDNTTLFGVIAISLICIAFELRDLNSEQTTSQGFDKMMYDVSQSLKTLILSPLHKKQKKCDLYSDTSKCPEDKKHCNECTYFN